MGIKQKKRSQQAQNFAQNRHPRSLKYYLSASSYQKAIGKFATYAFFQLKDFLSTEIALPQPKKVASELARVLPLPVTRDSTPEEVIKSNHEKLKALTTRSNEVLASATSVFPFALFPDTVTLDRNKITITQRDFFFSSRVNSIRIEDVLNVTSDVGPIFGSITVVIRVMSTQDHFPVNWFWRKDAIHLKHMIHGYVIAQHNKIKVDHLEKEELIKVLDELGHDSNK